MLDRVTLIKIPLPAEEDRAGYFDRMINGTKLTLEEGFTGEEMAAATDNHSYRDLDRLKTSMLIKLKSLAIAQNRVLDAEGNVDQQATDERASNAILRGEIALTRALFAQTQKENPPSDKVKSRQELKEFEERVAALEREERAARRERQPCRDGC